MISGFDCYGLLMVCFVCLSGFVGFVIGCCVFICWVLVGVSMLLGAFLLIWFCCSLLFVVIV